MASALKMLLAVLMFTSIVLTMISTKLASSRKVLFSPKAFTRVVMFFLASGRLIARMAGLRGLRRKRAISCRGERCT